MKRIKFPYRVSCRAAVRAFENGQLTSGNTGDPEKDGVIASQAKVVMPTDPVFVALAESDYDGDGKKCHVLGISHTNNVDVSNLWWNVIMHRARPTADNNPLPLPHWLVREWLGFILVGAYLFISPALLFEGTGARALRLGRPAR